MKKFLMVFMVPLLLLLSAGYSNEEKSRVSNAPAGLKEITGDVVKVNLNGDGNIVIDKGDITEEVVYLSYDYEEVNIGLLAVRDSSGEVKVVINTCQSCGGSPYAYFVQVGDKIQCQNCGNLFAIDELDNLVSDGCNPIMVEERWDDDEKITIGTEQLKGLKDKFENWKGPKA